MRCPFCSNTESKVMDKRDTEDNKATRRRRECLSCQKRYTTYERIESANLAVIKKNETRQPFDREKIIKGMLRACEKRPISVEQVEAAASEIEQEFLSSGIKEIMASEIGEAVMHKLKELDDVAYIRFASVYREFADLRSFEAALKQLKKKP